LAATIVSAELSASRAGEGSAIFILPLEGLVTVVEARILREACGASASSSRCGAGVSTLQSHTADRTTVIVVVVVVMVFARQDMERVEPIATAPVKPAGATSAR